MDCPSNYYVIEGSTVWVAVLTAPPLPHSPPPRPPPRSCTSRWASRERSSTSRGWRTVKSSWPSTRTQRRPSSKSPTTASSATSSRSEATPRSWRAVSGVFQLIRFFIVFLGVIFSNNYTVEMAITVLHAWMKCLYQYIPSPSCRHPDGICLSGIIQFVMHKLNSNYQFSEYWKKTKLLNAGKKLYLIICVNFIQDSCLNRCWMTISYYWLVCLYLSEQVSLTWWFIAQVIPEMTKLISEKSWRWRHICRQDDGVPHWLVRQSA